MNFKSLKNVIPFFLCSEKEKKTERVSYLNKSTLQCLSVILGYIITFTLYPQQTFLSDFTISICWLHALLAAQHFYLFLICMQPEAQSSNFEITPNCREGLKDNFNEGTVYSQHRVSYWLVLSSRGPTWETR